MLYVYVNSHVFMFWAHHKHKSIDELPCMHHNGRNLRVHMTGLAQKVLHYLPAGTTVTFEATHDALKAYFDPESHHTRFQAIVPSKISNTVQDNIQSCTKIDHGAVWQGHLTLPSVY